MENIYYVPDASYGKIIVFKLPSFTAIEEAVRAEAEGEGMHWSDCSWGSVRHITIHV